MASISASSLFTTDTNSSRVTGLASGMDVDELVESLSIGTQTKIHKIEQEIQINEWKTDAYRELTDMLKGFSDKYLSYTSKDNMLSSSSYSSYSVTTKGTAAQYLTVSTSTASGANAASNMVIGGVSSVASAAHYSTGGSLLNSKIVATGEISATYEDTLIDNIQGQSIGYKINDGSMVTYTFKSSTVSGAVSELNEQLKDSGFKAEYKDGTFSITADADSEGDNKITIDGVTSEMKEIFGLEVGQVIDSAGYTKDIDEASLTEEVSVLDNIVDESITVSYNGISRKITVSADDVMEYLSSDAAKGKTEEENTAAAIQYALQKSFDKTVGTNNDGSSKVLVGLEDNKITLQAMSSADTASTTNTLYVTAADAVLKKAAGFQSGSSNRIMSGAALNKLDLATELTAQDSYTIKVNDTELTFSASDSVDTIMSKINSSGAGITVSYSETSGAFSFVSNETGSQGRIEISDVSGNLTEALFGGAVNVRNGEDTVMEVSFDGGNTFQTITRSTASVNLDGVSISLDKDIVDADFTKPVSFVANNNTEQIVDKITSMIEEYNEIIEAVNTAVKTRPDSDYEPLSDEQKEEMTEEQVEKWEAKAKEGLLYGDSEIRTLTYELSQAVTGIVSGLGLPSSIGLSLSSDYNNGGTIEIDEEQLKTAVEENPDKVVQMFTNEDGVMERIQDVLDKYAGTTIQSNTYSRSRGILVNKAGLKDHMSATDNQLNDELEALKEELEKMNTRLDSEKERLYNKFSYLETFINQQNSIASWFTSQMGY